MTPITLLINMRLSVRNNMVNMLLTGEHNGGRKLRDFIDAMQRLPYICLIPACLTIIPGFVTTRDVSLSLFLTSGLTVFSGWGVRLWYRLNPDSFNAFVVFKTGGALILLVGFLVGIWEARRFSDMQWLFTDYVYHYIIVFLGVWAGTVFRLIKYGKYVREMYGYLSTSLPQGVIADHQLWQLMSPGGAIEKTSLKVAASAGFAVFGTMLAGMFGGRDAVGYFYFLSLLMLTSFLFGTTTARLWAHWKYLHWRDLRILWS